ncbi:MAG: hypothetical protein LUE10_02605 [Alistipes sp.]|nr:hypothetical protein [Alistipes sp.]
MNHTETIREISRRTGIGEEVCRQVLDTFEQVVGDGLLEKRWKKGVFDTILRMMNAAKARSGGKEGNKW